MNDDMGFRPRGRMGGNQSFSPVSVGEELEVTIEAVGEKGDGIAKKKGFVLFVPNTKEGQRVKIKVTKVLKKVGFAEVVGSASAASEEPEEEDSKDEGSQEDSSEEESEPEEENPEDSEDFGEDSDEDKN